MDMYSDQPMHPVALDKMVRLALGEATTGISVGRGTRVHLSDSSPDRQLIARAILDAYATLPVRASASVLTEDDPAPQIVCASALIADDGQMGYVVLLDGEIYAEGVTPIIAGGVTLNLIDPVAGVYDVFLFRQRGDYACGMVQIHVMEGQS